MGPGEKIMLLTLVVALSAYIATIRFAIIGRLGSFDNEKKRTWRKVLAGLIPADSPLVIAGIFLTIDLFLKDMINVDPPSFFYLGSLWLFFIAVIVLAIHHVLSWKYTLEKWSSS